MMKVLILDDKAEKVALIKKFCEDFYSGIICDYHVVGIVADAQKECEQYTFSAMFLDNDLGQEQCGTDFARWLVEDPTRAGTAAIYLSTNNTVARVAMDSILSVLPNEVVALRSL